MHLVILIQKLNCKKIWILLPKKKSPYNIFFKKMGWPNRCIGKIFTSIDKAFGEWPSHCVAVPVAADPIEHQRAWVFHWQLYTYCCVASYHFAHCEQIVNRCECTIGPLIIELPPAKKTSACRDSLCCKQAVIHAIEFLKGFRSFNKQRTSLQLIIEPTRSTKC